MSSPKAEDANQSTEASGDAPAQADLLAAARKEAAESHERYVRAVADLENYRKRAIREKDELRQFATTRLIEDLLPALDNLGLGLAAAANPEAGIKTLASGVELVQQQLKAALAAHGLKEVNPVGEAFDPHKHEAISHEPSPDVASEHVISVVRTGYTLNGRLIRPASVIVSSGPGAKSPAH